MLATLLSRLTNDSAFVFVVFNCAYLFPAKCNCCSLTTAIAKGYYLDCTSYIRQMGHILHLTNAHSWQELLCSRCLDSPNFVLREDCSHFCQGG
jgi:hypothetical protein